jgi:hypothetical protein
MIYTVQKHATIIIPPQFQVIMHLNIADDILSLNLLLSILFHFISYGNPFSSNSVDSYLKYFQVVRSRCPEGEICVNQASCKWIWPSSESSQLVIVVDAFCSKIGIDKTVRSPHRIIKSCHTN